MNPLICLIAQTESRPNRDRPLYAPPEMTHRLSNDTCCLTSIMLWRIRTETTKSSLSRDLSKSGDQDAKISRNLLSRWNLSNRVKVDRILVIPEDLRRSLIAPAEVSINQGPSHQRIRFFVSGELKEFNGRDRDEDRARS